MMRTFFVVAALLRCANASLLQRILFRKGARTSVDEVKIGVIAQNNTPIMQAVSLWEEGVVEEGGVDVGGTLHPVKLIVEEVGGAEEAVAAATKLIEEDEVLAIVGPDWSSRAIPASEIANQSSTPLVSATSSNPLTTLDKPWVFRATFTDPFQGFELAQFAAKEFGFSKVGVLFDEEDAYPTGLATYFKKEWENLHGEDSVASVTTFFGNTTDFKPLISEVMESGAEFLFLPQYADQLPDIMNQAQEVGWDKPVVGGDGWDRDYLPANCGAACNGSFFGTQFFAENVTGFVKEFVDTFNSTYGEMPVSNQALNFDSIRLVEDSIKRCGSISGDLVKDRTCIRDAMASTENFLGVAQNITFDENGDPQKCAVILQIIDEQFVFHDLVCPPSSEINDETNATASERGSD